MKKTVADIRIHVHKIYVYEICILYKIFVVAVVFPGLDVNCVHNAAFLWHNASRKGTPNVYCGLFVSLQGNYKLKVS